jgi:predicted acyltransferase
MAVPKQERLLSLDVFRGLTIAAMVLVNNQPSSSYAHPWLRHVAWDGWTIADLVFPFFLFIVGVALPYSVDSQLGRGASHTSIVLKALRRAIVLFLIGLALNGFPRYDLYHLRYFNVLQRIGVCYLVATVIELKMRPRSQVLLSAAILIGYFVLLKFVPVPGGAAGVFQREGSWVQYIDLQLIAGHMQSPRFESKGLLSTVPALVTVLIGVWTGRRLKTAAPPMEKAADLYFYGTLGALVGCLWSLWVPIIQGLWTSSLVLFMGGLALVVLASCYYLVDIKQVRWWTPPLLVLGTNALSVWTFDWLLRVTLRTITVSPSPGQSVELRTYLWQQLSTWIGPSAGCMLFAVADLLFWLAVMGVLYRKRIFIKI